MQRAAFRPAARVLGRRCLNPATRRFASTSSPVDRPRSFKSSAIRWALAGGAVYYYSTSSVFAEEPSFVTEPAPSHFSESDLPTVDSIVEEKRKQIQDKLESKNVVREKVEPRASEQQSPSSAATPAASIEGSPEALEEEAGQQGAFNPETGEINWGCPCLGGMADGPCGEQFKAAFSCFVYSDAEPKGMDCIEKFQGMQDCFREHPDVYGAELADDEEAEANAAATEAQAATDAETLSAPAEAKTGQPETHGDAERQQLRDAVPASAAEKKEGAASKMSNATSVTAAEASDPFPTKWDDATAANDKVNKEEMKNPAEKQEEKEKKSKKEA